MIGARKSDNTCRISIPRPLPTIECNPVRVREIFSNLASNAIKYNLHDKPLVEITYSVTEDQGQIVYCVRDDGIGIEERHFEQIFRMFKRLHGRDEFGDWVGYLP